MDQGVIYLDNAASTQPSPEVCDFVYSVMRERYGNPSSLHGMGIEAERYVGEARARVAQVIGARPENIVFTSGGTEANNIAILSVCGGAPRGAADRIITTELEHPSVYEPLKKAAERGWKITCVPAGADGSVAMGLLGGALDGNVALIALTHANNETGAVFPAESIGKLRDSKCPDALIHLDCVQSFAKLRFLPERCGADTISVSSHKIHGPKGVGALYISGRACVKPVYLGGGQENGVRPGTENVPAIAGFGLATQEAARMMDESYGYVARLREKFLAAIRKSGIEYIEIAGEAGEANNGRGVYGSQGANGFHATGGGQGADGFHAAGGGQDANYNQQACGAQYSDGYHAVGSSRKTGGCLTSPYILVVAFPGAPAEVMLNHLSGEGVYVSSGAACSSRRSVKTGSRVLISMGLRREIIDSAIRISFSRYNTETEIEAAAEKTVRAATIIRKQNAKK